MATPLPRDPTALAGRLLEAHFRARETFTRAIEPILSERFDLDVRDYMILKWIGQQDLTPGRLAQLLRLPGYATSRLLDPFIKRGLVQRVVDGTDARRYRLHLTDHGRGVVQAISEEVAALLGRLLNELGPERTELLLDSFDVMARLEVPPPNEGAVPRKASSRTVTATAEGA